ncbi:transposase [Streptomyces sp. NPDC001315]|uniref:transposase n=1 Tax=Streptomyces sp. NPDC001315 TaxID=3364562 RepID=UPI003676FD2F
MRPKAARRSRPRPSSTRSRSRAPPRYPRPSRGYDSGKKINGRRRHAITDTLGLLLMVPVCAADVTDRQAARVMLPRLRTRFRMITLV